LFRSITTISIMDTSSIEHTTDSGDDTEDDFEEQIPIAVPVASIAAIAATTGIGRPSRDDIESDGEGDDDEHEQEAAATFDTAVDNDDDGDDDDDVEETGSHATDMTPLTPSTSKKRSSSEISEMGNQQSNNDNSATPHSQTSSLAGDDENNKKQKSATQSHNDGRPRQPAAKGLTIPFRTIKRIMKMDVENIGIVQNDAAIVATAALEHFVKTIAVKSLELATSKGRNTIKYDDVAEVRANDRSLSFLDLLLP